MAKPAQCAQPAAAAKLATLLGPAAAALWAVSQSRQFQKSLAWKLLLGGSATLAGVCLSAHQAASWQLKALPSDNELRSLGGHRFTRPSDGQPMEYWLSGPGDSHKVVVFCHRMDGALGIEYGKDKVQAVLQAKGARLLSPSVPSLSGSPPYQTDRPEQWLRQWTEDMMHLLEQLGAKEVYVVGLSWGAQLALNLAMACQNKGLLRGIGQIGGQYWDTRKVVYKNGVDAGGDTVKAIFSKPWVVKPLAYLLIRPFIPMMGDVAGTMPEAEVTSLKANFGQDLAVFGQGMIRSMSYFLHQNWQVGALSATQEVNNHVDLAALDPKIPVLLFLGEHDRMANEMQQPFLDQVKHAELKRFQGSHCGFPFDEILSTLLR